MYGHAIQYFIDPSFDFKVNPVFNFIYSFHMPLFMMMSGYFFSSSMKYGFVEFGIRRFKSLIIPVITWSVIMVTIKVMYHLLSGKNVFEFEFVKNFVLLVCRSIFTGFWFVKSVLMCYVICFIPLKITKSYWSVGLFALLIILFFPDYQYYKSMLPFFFIGVLMKDKMAWFVKYSKWLLLGSFIVAMATYNMWNFWHTMYVSSFQLFKPLSLSFEPRGVDSMLLRLVLGGSISVFIILLTKLFYNKDIKIINIIGQSTLGIYLMQTLIFELLSNKININVDIALYNFIIAPLVTLSIIGVIVLFMKWLKRYNNIYLFIFG